MSRYIKKQVQFFEEIVQQRDEAPSAHHRAILDTYLRHAAFELVGEVGRLFEPDMMVDEPVYKILGLGAEGLHIYRGKDAVRRRFYDNLNESVVVAYDETRAVADWGLAFFCTVGTLVSAGQLTDLGYRAEDPERSYLIEYFCAERWPFDEDARLIGEEVYQIGSPVISELTDEDVFTIESRNAAVRRFVPGTLSEV